MSGIFAQAFAQDRFEAIFLSGEVQGQGAFEIIIGIERAGFGTGGQGAHLREAGQGGVIVFLVPVLNRLVKTDPGRLGKTGLRGGEGRAGFFDSWWSSWKDSELQVGFGRAGDRRRKPAESRPGLCPADGSLVSDAEVDLQAGIFGRVGERLLKRRAASSKRWLSR